MNGSVVMPKTCSIGKVCQWMISGHQCLCIEIVVTHKLQAAEEDPGDMLWGVVFAALSLGRHNCADSMQVQ